MASVNFRMTEGSRTTTRNVNAVGASGLTVVNTALVTAQIGDIAEIITSASGNIGFYTIYGLSGTLGYYLRPAPIAQPLANGTIARLNRATSIATSATSITSITALPGPGNLAAVQVSGANFLTNGVWRNDRAIISGGTVSGNQGGWYVQEVVSEDVVVLRPPDRGAGLVSGTGAVLTFRQGFHFVTAALSGNEVFGWSTLAASGILPVSGASLFQGSGELRDYLRVRNCQTGDFARRQVLIEGLAGVQLTASGLSGITWDSVNEAVFAARPDTGGTVSNFTLTLVSGNPAVKIPIRLGANPYGDRYSAISGSSWIGVRIQGNAAFTNAFTFGMIGSYFDNAESFSLPISSIASGIASIIRPSFAPASGALIESVIGYGTFGEVPTGAADSQNVLIASSSATGSIGDAGAVLGGLILASGTFVPFAATIFSTGNATVLDPRVDLDISVYFFNLLGGTIDKRFTFNPRLVSLDAPGAAPAPISGLYYQIYEIDEGTLAETLTASGFTNVNGYMNAGAGHQLRRQLLATDETLTTFGHRLVLQGGGFRLTTKPFQLSAKVTGDLDVQRIAPDYESEFDE